MTIAVEIDRRALDELWKLRRANRQALKETTPGESGLDDLVARAYLKLSDRWEHTAPRATGTLAAATRGALVGPAEGRVFIDPSVVNPVSGGKPAEYGPAVHQRKPWVAALVAGEAPAIMNELTQAIARRVEEAYRQ